MDTLPAGKFQILYVDDNPSDAHLLTSALEKAGTRVKIYWVATAQEGLEFLKQEGRFEGTGPVNIVISDVDLPGMNGMDFLAEAKRVRLLASIPFIMFSGSKDPRDIQRCYELGASSYVVKPMTLATFTTKIETLVRYWLDVVELPNPALLD